MKKILVTGANGLLGTNVIHALVAAGYNAIGLLRRKDSFRGALSGSLELVEGDITSQTDVMSAAAGCDAIIHCAACTSQSAGLGQYHEINTRATGLLLEAACRLGIKRVVNISTANIFAYGIDIFFCIHKILFKPHDQMTINRAKAKDSFLMKRTIFHKIRCIKHTSIQK